LGGFAPDPLTLALFLRRYDAALIVLIDGVRRDEVAIQGFDHLAV
jgi:hypothetical protein